MRVIVVRLKGFCQVESFFSSWKVSMSKRKFEVIFKESQQNQKQKQNGIIVYFANRKQNKQKKTVHLSNNTNKLQVQRYDSFATNINNFIDKNIKDNK